MSIVVAEISMSLDGFVTGPDPDLVHGLGRDGEALHTWAVASDDPIDRDVLGHAMERTGAVVMGGGCSTSWTAPTAGTTRWASVPGRRRRRRSSW